MTHDDAGKWLRVIIKGLVVLVLIFEIGHHYFGIPSNSITMNVVEKLKQPRR